MANERNGWIKLHRKLLDCWIWKEKPYDKARAWIDLLLLAMHHDTKMLVENEILVIPRGSFMTSVLKLSERWGWSRSKTMRYLELLENEQMLNTKRTPKGTLVTIIKYEDFQSTDTTVDTTVDTQNKNIKNDKELKNEKNNTIPQGDSATGKKKPKEEKHRYGEYNHVLLTDRQFERLVNDYGEFEVHEAIKFLDEYIQMKGYKAKDHNLAIRKWVFEAVEREKGKNNQQRTGSSDDYWNGI